MPRTPKPPRPFDPKKAARHVEGLRAGDGLTAALKRSRLTDRTLFCWLAAARRKGPVGVPYRKFQAEIIGLIAGAMRFPELPPGFPAFAPDPPEGDRGRGGATRGA